MTKRSNSKFSFCKKIPLNYKNVWGTKKNLRSIKVVSRKNKRISFYNRLIKSKQCLINFYSNVGEQRFKKSFKTFVKSKAKNLSKFVSFAESRLDVILYRVGFVSSLHQARQFINHGHILINYKKAYISSTNVSKNSLIQVSKNNVLLKKVIYLNVYQCLYQRSTILHVEVNYKLQTLVFLWDPDFKSIFFPVNTTYTLISRFY
jgi:small subunit ribosomal protein S4